MNRAGQKVGVASRLRAALCGNVDASTPKAPSGSAPGKHFALLSEQPTQGHHSGGVAVRTWHHAAENANGDYRHRNGKDGIKIKPIN